MPPKNKKSSNDRPKRESSSKFRQDIVGILLIALAVFVFIANISNATGLLGLILVKNILRAVLGIGVLVLPFFITAYGVILIIRHEIKELTLRLTGLFFLLIVYVSVAQFYSDNYFAGEAVFLRGAGGMLGFGVKDLLLRIVGIWGSYIVLTALALIGCLMVLNITLLNLINFFSIMLRQQGIGTKKEKDVKEEGKKLLAAQVPLIKNMPTEMEVIAPPPEPKAVVEFPLPKFEAEVDIHSKEKSASAEAPKTSYLKYKLPSLDLLEDPSAREKQQAEKLRETTELRKKLLEEALRNFGVGARVVAIMQGPAVTRYELQPEPGVKVSRIANLADDIALNLAAQGVRIESPVPGKSVIGIEVPNASITPVRLKEIVRTNEFRDNPSKLFIGIGKDLSGMPVYGDLAKMPHLLIAGTTGSGKSVCINSLIVSMLMRARPDEVKMLMIDPKMVELSIYDGIAHLLTPVVTNPRKAAATMKEWVIKEMENRYKIFHEEEVRNLQAFNRKAGEERRLPQIVVIIDELADLMMVAATEVETAICRIAQLARATGIHLLIATQRPSVDVITGLIKANIPSRIAFAVATQIDSRVILDMSGAEKLLGRGDMLYNPIGAMKPIRLQGSFVTDKETERIIKYVKDQASPEYIQEIADIKVIEKGAKLIVDSSGEGEGGGGGRDSLFADVARLIVESGQPSTSYIQRKFRIGYNRAARLMDEMEEAGIVSPPEGELKIRKVTATREILGSLGIN